MAGKLYSKKIGINIGIHINLVIYLTYFISNQWDEEMKNQRLFWNEILDIKDGHGKKDGQGQI